MLQKNSVLIALSLFMIPCVASAQEGFSGFYGGAAAGYGFNGTSETVVNGPSVFDFDIKGSQISLLGGYNFQSDNFVLGLEVDVNFGKATDSQTVSVAPLTYAGTAELGTYYSLRARIGFTPSETLLLFGTAGPAWGELATTAVLTGAALGPLAPFKAVDTSKSVSGHMLGLGGEYKLGQAATVRLEYSELYLNGFKFTSTSPFGGTSTLEADNSISYVRSGVTFKF
jgi:outer membrane immunogenic protein